MTLAQPGIADHCPSAGPTIWPPSAALAAADRRAGMRYALGIEYDGSAFCGWQSQAGGGAVQDAVEAALAIIADAPTRVVCAGRTDAGVHALEQVAHFDTDARRPDSAWVRGVNSHLPSSVAVRWAQAVPMTSMRDFPRAGAAIAICC
jgi:hypothetical protein